jgi:hypothetical protein
MLSAGRWATEERSSACLVACRACAQHQGQQWKNASAALKDAVWACLPLVLPGGVEHAECVVKNIFFALCLCVGHAQGRVQRRVPDDGKKRALAGGRQAERSGHDDKHGGQDE